MMKKLLGIIIITVFVFIISCSNKKPVITLVSSGGDSKYLSLLEKGALSAAEDNNVILNFIRFDEENNFEVQKNILKTEIEKEPDAIALSPIVGSDYLELLELIKTKKIPFFNFDSKLDVKESNILIASAYTDDKSISHLIAQKMFDVLKYRIEDFSLRNKAKIGVLQYDNSARATILSEGFVQSFSNITASDTNINIKGKYEIEIRLPKTDTITDVEIEADYFEENNFLAIYGTSEKMVEGIAATYSNIDINSAASDGEKVIICGVDGGDIQIDAIKKGIIYGSAIKNPYFAGYFMVELAILSLAGGVATDNTIAPKWYDKDNIDSKEISVILY